MKPIWYIIGVACVLISSMGRMADSLSDVLIALGVIALVVLVIWLFETGKIRLNERLGRILKKIGVGIFIVVGIAYLVAMAGFVTCKVATEGDRQGIILLGITSVAFGISWYISRWRRRWVKFLKTFMPKDKIRHGDWKIREKYFQTFDYATNALYGLRTANGIFDGQARVWLDPSDVDKDASARLDAFEAMLAKCGIKANCALTHIPGCIYADIVAEINYKSMNSDKWAAFRDAFHELDGMNYHGDYYAEYHGKLGTIFIESNAGNVISRAIRTEPREEYYLDSDCGFQSEEAHYFIERGVDWTEGTYSLISDKEFFSLWRERLEYDNKDDAYSFFEQASLMYFAAVANGDKKEQTNSRWDIENAAKYLITHDAKDEMIELMAIYEQSMYWASRLFVDVVPEYALDTAKRLVEYCDNPYIVSHTKRLISQWKRRQAMKNKIFIITIMLTLSAIVCSGQSFLSKYPKLTKKNLNEFFSNWEAYSDSIASRAVKNDSLIDMVVAYNYLPMQLEGGTFLTGKNAAPKYHVVPQYIDVERYYMDVDTTLFSPRYGFPYHYSELKDNEYRIDSIIPQLPYRGLYLTSDISETLSTFVGGCRNGDKIQKINKGNLKILKKYIPVDYGHWGGYWWFTPFPLITNICYADNLIAVKIRTSWWAGEETWYIKKDDEFVRREEPAGEWIE